MATIHNEINISAPVEKIWNALSEVESLENYDPAVMKSVAVSSFTSGIGAKRKVNMKDGKKLPTPFPFTGSGIAIPLKKRAAG